MSSEAVSAEYASELQSRRQHQQHHQQHHTQAQGQGQTQRLTTSYTLAPSTTTTRTTTTDDGNRLRESVGDITPIQRAIIDISSGTIGGIGLVLVGYPTDTVKVRLQTQSYINPTYNGAIDCFVKIYRTEGIRGFLKGIQSPLYGQMLFNAIQFMSYSASKDTVNILFDKPTHAPLTIPQYWLSGAIVGFVVSIIECPMDLFKTQLQTQIFHNNPSNPSRYQPPLYNTFNGAVKYITKHYGIRGWYQGLLPTIYRNIPSVANYFMFYETSKKLEAYRTGKEIHDLSALEMLGCGWIGGIGYWMLTFPIDVVKSKIQSEPPDVRLRKFTSFTQTAKYLYKTYGIKRFFGGYGICVLRAG
jgi:hypothetical protein